MMHFTCRSLPHDGVRDVGGGEGLSHSRMSYTSHGAIYLMSSLAHTALFEDETIK